MARTPKQPSDDQAASGTGRSLVPVVDRLVEHRHHAAAADVARLRAEHPDDTPDQLADRLIRRYAKDLAVSGAVTGGAAASPVAGVAVAAASAGADAAVSVNRLGEMIMALGIIYGHEALSVEERRAAVLTVMGIADGAAVGMTGLAARAGAKGGARVLRRLPAAGTAATGGVARRTVTKLSSTKGPWSLTSLIPYGIGAGVGAAGNALLARAVGRAAKEYFSTGERALPHSPAGDGADTAHATATASSSGPAGAPGANGSDTGHAADDDLLDGDVIDGEWLSDEVLDDDIVDAEIVD